MSWAAPQLSRENERTIQNIVHFTVRPTGMDDVPFCENLFRRCVDALEAGDDLHPLIRESVTDAFQYYHRRTENSYFAEQLEQITGKKRGNSGAPRVKDKSRSLKIIKLTDRPMSPVRPDYSGPKLSDSKNAMTYQAYSGTLSLEFTTPDRPPSPTRTDYPSVAWNPTGVALPSNSEKRIAKQKLDPARLQQWRAQDRRGFPNQQQVMNGYDATSVACAALLHAEVMKAPPTNFGNSSWEWLHLVSFKMGGIDNNPQQPGNLVAGTYECNSLMISIEEAIKDLVLLDRITLFVSVVAKCHPGTHVGTRIDYYVYYQKTPDDAEIVFDQEFYPLRHINPASGDKDIFKKAMKRHFGLED